MGAKATAQPRTSISPIFNWKESATVNKYKPVVATTIPSTMKMVAFCFKKIKDKIGTITMLSPVKKPAFEDVV